jgi:hypothetical protein
MSTTEKMARNAQNYRERIDEIRGDWTKSDEAKRQDLEAAFAQDDRRRLGYRPLAQVHTPPVCRAQ